jgi:hypothetical protein
MRAGQIHVDLLILELGTLHTFGYGSDHNGTFLTNLAQAGKGSYYFLEKPDDIPNSFGMSIHPPARRPPSVFCLMAPPSWVVHMTREFCFLAC